MNWLTLDFFTVIQTFYDWVFPLNLLAAAGMLGGLAAGLLSRRRSRLWCVFPLASLGVLLVTEMVWQLFRSEYLALFCVLGWVAEAALLSWAAGTMARAILEKLRKAF